MDKILDPPRSVGNFGQLGIAERHLIFSDYSIIITS